jgi:K+-transporting ATPase KdpF subunit
VSACRKERREENMMSMFITFASETAKEATSLNSTLEYILVGIVTLGILIYLFIALLAPEKF